MKRYFITAAFLCASAFMSCRNITAVTPADTDQVEVLHCAQEGESECEDQPADTGKVDITSPLCIFLLN